MSDLELNRILDQLAVTRERGELVMAEEEGLLEAVRARRAWLRSDPELGATERRQLAEGVRESRTLLDRRRELLIEKSAGLATIAAHLDEVDSRERAAALASMALHFELLSMSSRILAELLSFCDDVEQRLQG